MFYHLPIVKVVILYDFPVFYGFYDLYKGNARTQRNHLTKMANTWYSGDIMLSLYLNYLVLLYTIVGTVYITMIIIIDMQKFTDSLYLVI